MKYWLIAIAASDKDMATVKRTFDSLWEVEDPTLSRRVQGVTDYGTYSDKPGKVIPNLDRAAKDYWGSDDTEEAAPNRVRHEIGDDPEFD
jgi:hypothetical protein